MTYQTIEVSRESGIVTLALDRPTRRNAWTYEMGDELQHAIRSGNADPDVEAFVVTGNGQAFCAGADVRDLFQARADADDRSPSTSRGWVRLIREAKPIVAAVNGPAIGLGVTQILPMDFLVASTDARLSVRFVKMGLVPELGSSQFLVARCGLGAASELMLSGRTVDAKEALRIGLIDRVVAPDALRAEARAVAKSMGENPQAALHHIKALITQNMAEPDLAAVERRELEALDACFQTAEHREAIAAHLEKRAPDFRGARTGTDPQR